MQKEIKHEGLVYALVGNKAKVKLVNTSACSSCHAKAICTVSEVDNKEIEVDANLNHLQKGDRINVFFGHNQGIKALFLGYMLPFFIVLGVLLVVWVVTGNEKLSGLWALLVLVPYYLILSFFKKRLVETFSFKVEKLKQSI